MKLGGPQFWYETVYNGLALEDEELSQLPEAITSIRIYAQTIYNAHQVALSHARPYIPTPSSSSDGHASLRSARVRALSACT